MIAPTARGCKRAFVGLLQSGATGAGQTALAKAGFQCGFGFDIRKPRFAEPMNECQIRRMSVTGSLAES
jgi:hypothetical protein